MLSWPAARFALGCKLEPLCFDRLSMRVFAL